MTTNAETAAHGGARRPRALAEGAEVGEDPTSGPASPAPDASTSGGAGSERQPCYPNGTCDAPLRCISAICVLPAEGRDASTADSGSNGSSSGGVLSDSGSDSSPADAGPQTIQALVAANSSLSTFAEYVVTNEVNDTLSGPGPYTLFAPTNAAFDAAGVLALNADEVSNHIVGQLILQGDFDGTATSLSGKTLGLESGRVYLAGGTPRLVLVTDIQASNGVIHIIDGVLLDE